MPIYAYWAKDMHGENIRGHTEIPNEMELVETLHDQGLVVVSISESKHDADGYKPIKIVKSLQGLFQGKVKLFEMLLFASQLSAMIGAGIHLLRALGSLAKEMRNKTFSKVIAEVHRDVGDGSTFHSALAKHPRIFSNVFVNLVRAGENSGNLEEILNQYVTYLERSVNLKRKVKLAIIYPAFILSFAVLVVTLMVWKLVPIFQQTYADFGVELPLPTQILISINQGIRNNILAAFLIIMGITLSLYAIGKSKRGRLWFDRLKLNLPVFGDLVQKATMARFARTMGVLVASGLPILDCLDIASLVSDNALIEKVLHNSRLAIQEGSKIVDALKKGGIFPGMIIQMVDTGEQTGQLDRMLLKSADFYDQQAEGIAAVLTALLEPTLIICLGGIIGFILISLFLPIFKLGKVFVH